MGINVVISIKYGQKSCIQDIKFKFYWVSKSIPAAKSQDSVDISGAQKPIWAKLLEFDFFLSGKTRLYRYYQNKNWSNHFHT